MKRFIGNITVLALAVLAPLSASPAMANDYSVQRDFYSDATLTTYVGWAYRNCHGKTLSMGTVTPYYIETREGCI
ncbi:MAG: DUF6289 family protein [Brevundimonas sp.]|uniref:DUF6289 family protein n=1 Tax=Brevundimonas sp. TaxID=1871086 RepID=UPI00271B2A35|nr:DUF6289 family protein [Brevundimonas sp.]MDO9608938.1 DUF6289 family protein [Brevundimonas sp.]